jgi:hypothetical protein
MDENEFGVLEACHEVVHRQQEMLPLLAAAVGVPPEEVFYTWALRKCNQHGDLEGTDWWYFFHGAECDLRNKADRRFMRIDFGPGGRIDTFTAWGVLQFIMTSAPPWAEFTQLRVSFAEHGPPYDEFSGSMPRMCEVWDRLAAQGVFEKADPGLLAFEARYTKVGPDGINRVQFPVGTPEKTQIDCSVANRNRLSPRGIAILESRSQTMVASNQK